ncbi:hypothetical protein PIB30_058449 [Stylosanthes scabra]|uniref:Uncharacterized protein n=1 Tax=Stylosanthes scabra TaxID=79078 RepID=A0ABU6SKD0_9FABA|nr:hypothetical protein [Stylosanthes scabra]
MMPLQFRPTTGNIILKKGAMVNLLVGSHLNSHKLSLGNLIPTVSLKIAKIPDISLHIIVSTIRTVQRENQEMREAQKRTESQLNHLAEQLQKIANQSPVNSQAQAQPSAPSPLLSQPLPNPKGGINAVQVEIDNEVEDEAENEEGENDSLYELLKELANFDDEEDEESEDESEEEDEDESTEEDSEDEFVEEGDQAEEEAREEDRDKGKIFFINTLFKE